ncbi:DNA modification system-associated small protein [Anaerobacillus sp. MEB173]|uniref:DNA modification system-associated small protein n=1 Tax=Anaerobacillus sp. MEB173 TaxID=3383345 RepID=UPI003F905FA0
MNKIRLQEKALLEKICNENNLSVKLVSELIKSAEKFSYENISLNVRIKEYLDLINFYATNDKGDS